MELPRQDPDQLLRAIRNDASTKKKAENSKSFSVMPQVSERPMPCFRRLIRRRSVASMWLLDT